MNCDLGTCGKHILATTQVAWNGGNYHADCVVEAVNQNRAKTEIPKAESNLPEDYFEQLEQHDNDFYEGENLEHEDDIDEFEEEFEQAINRLDNSPIIPEVVEPGFQPKREVHINEVVSSVGNQFAAERQVNGTLMAHCGTVKVDRHFLTQIGTPEETDTFKPIAHSTLIDAIEEALAYRRIRLVRSEFAVSKDGMKMFGLLEVNNEFDGIRFAIGLRNANDKSMRLAMVAGYRVFVCDNMSLAGDFKPLLAKHTKNLDLIESVSTGIDRIQRGWEPLKAAIQLKRETKLCTESAKLFIYKAFTEGKIPISLFRSVHSGYFEAEEQKTVWGIENAFTDSFKKLLPVSQFENTAKLGKLIQAYQFD